MGDTDRLAAWRSRPAWKALVQNVRDWHPDHPGLPWVPRDSDVLAIEADAQGVRAGDDGLNLARLERFIDYTQKKPRYVTANGIRQDMPVRFHADALALRAALAAQPAPSEAETLREYRRWGYAAGVEAAQDGLRAALEPAIAIAHALLRDSTMGQADHTAHLWRDCPASLCANAREALAAQPAPTHAPGDHHEYDIKCRICGQAGVVRLSVEPDAYEP